MLPWPWDTGSTPSGVTALEKTMRHCGRSTCTFSMQVRSGWLSGAQRREETAAARSLVVASVARVVGMGQVHEDLAWEKGQGSPGLSRAVPTVSLRWTKLPPVKPAIRGQAPVVPYMRYGHSTVLIDDTVFLWGGRNDTEGACNVLFAFDVSEYGSLRASWLEPGRGGVAGGTGKRAPEWRRECQRSLIRPFSHLQILTSGPHPECQVQFLEPGMDIRLVYWAKSCTFSGAMSSW